MQQGLGHQVHRKRPNITVINAQFGALVHEQLAVSSLAKKREFYVSFF